jgi:PTH1 family peptidyl-tRNA hydrolase
MQLLVGLGNPGPSYALNRHNVGFMAVDAIVRRHGLSTWRARFHGLVADGQVAGRKVLALKPLTYMNRSGLAVGEATRFFKIAPAQVIVFHDELDLSEARIRVKRGGGAAGHNGLRSIDAHIGADYWRVRFGIGHPGESSRVRGHVLHDFGRDDASWLEPLLAAVADELPRLLDGDAPGFMSRVAHLSAPPKPKQPSKPSPGRPRASEPQADRAGPEKDGDRGV